MISFFSKIYQLKVTLGGVEPKVWRLIQVPSYYSFEDLHLIIQDAMGWKNSSEYVFSIKNPETGELDKITSANEDEDLFEKVTYDNEVELSEYFTSLGSTALYEYDFNDGWEHEVVLEKSLQIEDYADYPKCIGGERACPPENCGGVLKYEDIVKILKDQTHRRHKEIFDRYRNFDPDEFDPKNVSFYHFNNFLIEEKEEEKQ